MRKKPVYYYGRPYERALFTNKGWRGRLVLILHRLWCYLGRLIERRIANLIVRRQFHGEERKAVLRTIRFHMDQEDRGIEGKSPLAAFGVPGTQIRASYAEGRKNGPVEEERLGPVSDETLARIARLRADVKRRPYTYSRDTLLVDEVEADSVPESELLQGDNHGSTS